MWVLVLALRDLLLPLVGSVPRLLGLSVALVPLDSGAKAPHMLS